MKAYKGLIVLILGIHSNGTAEQAAVVTRVWEPKPHDVVHVNLLVMPDEGLPTTRPSVAYYESLEAANKAQANMPFCYPSKP